MFYQLFGVDYPLTKAVTGWLFGPHGAAFNRWQNDEFFLEGHRFLEDVPMSTHFYPLGEESHNRTMPVQWTKGKVLLSKTRPARAFVTLDNASTRSVQLEPVSGPTYQFNGFLDHGNLNLTLKHGDDGRSGPPVTQILEATIIKLDGPWAFQPRFPSPGVMTPATKLSLIHI